MKVKLFGRYLYSLNLPNDFREEHVQNVERQILDELHLYWMS